MELEKGITRNGEGFAGSAGTSWARVISRKRSATAPSRSKPTAIPISSSRSIPLSDLARLSEAAYSERALHQRANEFHVGPEPIRIRRMLERPVGSVRWKDETPDRSTTDHAPTAGPGAGP
jgi:hypothetical protein